MSNTPDSLTTLLRLLHNELWGATLPDNDRLPHTGERWIELYREASRQTVTALAFNALERIDAYAPAPPAETAARWMAEAEHIRRRNTAMDCTLHRILATAERKSIPVMVMKGQPLARLYPDPEARQCGDIDLFTEPGNREALTATLKDEGAAIIKQNKSDGSTSLLLNGIEIEIHGRYFDIHSPASRQRLAKPYRDQPAALPGTPEAMLLMLSAHILKHAMGRGIGLRQLCDLAMATKAYHNKIDPQLMSSLIHRTRLDRWTDTVYSFLVVHLGMPEKLLPYPGITVSATKADRLLKIVSRGGNFGLHRDGSSGKNSAIHTAASFVRSARFSLATAPREAVWSFLSLTRGRMRNLFRH